MNQRNGRKAQKLCAQRVDGWDGIYREKRMK